MKTFETKFVVSKDGDLVYNLKIGKGFRRGVPNMMNDVMVRVTQQQTGRQLSPAKIKEIAKIICYFLNKEYVLEIEED